jgi:hypothetical protein
MLRRGLLVLMGICLVSFVVPTVSAESGGEVLYSVPKRHGMELHNPFGHTVAESGKTLAVAEKKSEKAVVPEKKAEPVKDKLRPRVCGVVDGAGGRMAIIEHDGKSAVYGAGDMAGRFRVVRIEGDGAVLSDGSLEYFGRIGQ